MSLLSFLGLGKKKRGEDRDFAEEVELICEGPKCLGATRTFVFRGCQGPAWNQSPVYECSICGETQHYQE